MTSLYNQSVPVMVKQLHAFSDLLQKGQAYADERGMKHEEMLNFRLIADMAP